MNGVLDKNSTLTNFMYPDIKLLLQSDQCEHVDGRTRQQCTKKKHEYKETDRSGKTKVKKCKHCRTHCKQRH